MPRLSAPAIWIPLLFGVCGFITLILPSSGGLQVLAVVGLFFMVALLIAVFVHEVGHAIGAMWARFQIINLIVGPFLIAARVKGGYKLLPNMNPLFWGGLIYALPHSFADLRRRFVVYLSGGVIANLVVGLLFAIVAAVIWTSWQTSIPTGVSLTNFNIWSIGCFISLIGWTSLFMFIGNILPFRTPSIASDGLKLLQLRKDDDTAKRSIALLTANCLLLARERPNHFPDDLVNDALAFSDNSPEEAEAELIAYLKSVDSQTIDDANLHIARLEKFYGSRNIYLPSRSIVAFWIAFHHAIYQENVSKARLWLNEAKVLTHSKALLLNHMASCAVLFLEGWNQEAIAEAEEWAALFNQEMRLGGGVVLFFKEQMEKVTKRNISAIKSMLPEVKR